MCAGVLGFMSTSAAPPAPSPTPWVGNRTYVAMMREFGDFEEEHGLKHDSVRGHPHPAEPDGLPVGWVVQACGEAIRFGTQVGSFTNEVCLVQRHAGGWGLVLHQWRSDSVPQTVLVSTVAPTVQLLHEKVRTAEHLARVGAAGLDVIRSYVVSRYDLADEVEAAEQALVALGAPVTMFPRALTERVEQKGSSR